MLKAAARRSVLRWMHLIVAIPIVGYIYGKPSDVAQYAAGVRFVFVPLIILSGYWMYRGIPFAVIGVGTWLGVFQFLGSGAAILGQMALFAVWNIWLAARDRTRR